MFRQRYFGRIYALVIDWAEDSGMIQIVLSDDP